MGHQLEGKTLVGVKIADDRLALLFQTTDGEVVARVDGDCCSRTWVENVELPAMGYPATVQAVEDLPLPDAAVGGPDEGTLVQFYGCRIATDKGYIDIDYRNESNGYYGGSLSWPGENHYGGVDGQNVSTMRWIDIESK